MRWKRWNPLNFVRLGYEGDESTSPLHSPRSPLLVHAGSHRTVYINEPRVHSHYKGNSVSTTKYSFFTFLPKGLFEQFRRVANLYFLMIAILSTTPISPVQPITNVLPLMLVLTVSLLKEAFEDRKRHLSDKVINASMTEVLRGKDWVGTPWSAIRVGDILRVMSDTYFPADMLCLASTNGDGICYIETSNLDGETNLKIRKALERTWDYITADAASELRAMVECEQPNNSLYTFTGNLVIGKQTIPISPNQMLLRGCSLRNTEWVVGAVIFTGHETKVMMNTMDVPSKRSTLERRMDLVILILFFLLFTICLVGAIGSSSFLSTNLWYLELDVGDIEAQYNMDDRGLVAFLSFLTLLTLYSTIIPISLYVSIEMIKFIQSTQFINKDMHMFHRETQTPALARTSNLNEELGQVEYIFTDKTGTLTRNTMEFFKCSIGGVLYGAGITEIQRAFALRTGQPAEEEYTGVTRLPSQEMEHGDHSHFDEKKMPTEGEAECLLEGLPVRARFDIKTGDFSWQPSKIHKVGRFPSAFTVAKSGSIHLPDQLLGFHFGASTILFKLFPKSGGSNFAPCGRARELKDILLDFRDHSDHGAFADSLEAWQSHSGRPRRLLVIVNPKSGKGKARETYLRQVLPLLEAAGITVTMLETNYHKHAIEIARGLNLNLYDGVACVSGDGIPTEVINGFLERPDWQRALQIPIGHIISGSGNGLCKTALDHGGEKVINVDNTTFAIVAGKRSALDVVTVSQGNKTFHSILNIGWGMVSDVDVESEQFRWMGGARLTLQTLVRTLALRRYEGTLTYLPATEEYLKKQTITDHTSLSTEAALNGVGPDGEFRGPSIEVMETAGEWETLEGQFVLIWGQNLPWAATDMNAAPQAKLCDGCMDACVVRECSSMQLLSLFMEMGTGKHVSSPLLQYIKVRAMKLNPGKRTTGKVQGGILTADGEVVARGEGAVGSKSDDVMDYDEPFKFTISQGLLQLFVA